MGIYRSNCTKGKKSEFPRVLLNGQRVQPGIREVLKNQDTLIFGHAHAYKLINPTEEQQRKAAQGRSGSVPTIEEEDLSLAMALEQVDDAMSDQFKKMGPYFAEIRNRLGEEQMKQFASTVNRVCPMVDEANLIVEAVRPKDGISFQIQVLTNLFDYKNDIPGLCVCVLHKTDKIQAFDNKMKEAFLGGNDGRRASYSKNPFIKHGQSLAPQAQEIGLGDHMKIGETQVLYVWSLEKFLTRLPLMRECHEEGADNDDFESVLERLNREPHKDPWREIALSEISLVIEQAAQGNLKISNRGSIAPRSDRNMSFASSVGDAEPAQEAPPQSGGGYRRASLLDVLSLPVQKLELPSVDDSTTRAGSSDDDDSDEEEKPVTPVKQGPRRGTVSGGDQFKAAGGARGNQPADVDLRSTMQRWLDQNAKGKGPNDAASQAKRNKIMNAVKRLSVELDPSIAAPIRPGRDAGNKDVAAVANKEESKGDAELQRKFEALEKEKDILGNDLAKCKMERDTMKQVRIQAQEESAMVQEQLRTVTAEVDLLHEKLRSAESDRDALHEELRQMEELRNQQEKGSNSEFDNLQPADVAGTGETRANAQKSLSDLLEVERQKNLSLREELARTRTTAQDALAAKVALSQELMKASEAMRELCKVVHNPAIISRFRELAAGNSPRDPRLISAPVASPRGSDREFPVVYEDGRPRLARSITPNRTVSRSQTPREIPAGAVVLSSPPSVDWRAPLVGNYVESSPLVPPAASLGIPFGSPRMQSPRMPTHYNAAQPQLNLNKVHAAGMGAGNMEYIGTERFLTPRGQHTARVVDHWRQANGTVTSVVGAQ